MSFDQYTLDEKCLNVLEKQGITEPTPIQNEAIPLALKGKDLIAVAQTGTGKTLAFTLPSITRLAEGPRRRTRMLVLTPTRELAQQVEKVIEPMARPLGLRTVCVFGGVGMHPQTKALRSGAEIVIATPGRLLDHIDRGNARFDSLSILTLDEADRMLDMGFLPDLRRIMGCLPKERQTLLFSATFPDEIARLAATFQRDPKRIVVAGATKAVETVEQNLYTVNTTDKAELLSKVLKNPKVKSAIVFMRTKHRTDKIAKMLDKNGIKAQAIHGGRSQAQRDRALQKFRKGRCNVLVATDVASRGIDIQGVTHVVNFDIPRGFDDYLHRIGRTGRANETGHAITFVSPEEHKYLADIERGLGKKLPRADWEGSVYVPCNFGSKSKAKPKHSVGGAKDRDKAKSKRGGGGKSFKSRRRRSARARTRKSA